MEDYTQVKKYLDSNLERSLEELARLCSQPSIAAQNLGMQECAQLVAEMLKVRDFQVEIMATDGAPVVYAERKGKRDKTLMFYNHYDVQPPEPLDEWISPPFEPEIRDGKMYARGVADDKGHIVSRLHAIDALLDQDGELPCNIKFVIEGEEETSSVHLHEFIDVHQSKLAADACVWEFGGVDFRDVPMQYLGLRGICYVELSVRTASIDAHSGLGGSIFPNAAWRLIWALRSIKGTDEFIRIPGHYDDVIQPSPRDLELIAALPEISEEYKQRYGVDGFLKGLQGGVDLRLQEVFVPTCTICGFTSGYQGDGAKTVLPAFASAKVDFRLVPNQKPEDVLLNLRKFLDDGGFEDIEITYLGGEPAARTDPDHPFVKLVVEAAEPVYGQPMQITPMIGGSGPNYPFIHTLGLPVVTAGVGDPGSQAHAPNENIRIDLYLKGAEHIARIIREFGLSDG
ncbi:MAG: M20/M25/M40 family metallo-hydrolase [Anaerolineales bacterium]|jgi:acetylornithine deacetylase/succinyl-diaminopimelate desuccinylase-like protein